MKFLVISDIHSNFAALSAFNKLIDDFSFDKIVVLGDLFTYGVDVKSTLQLLKEISLKYDCIFIKGNHDQIYFDLQAGVDYEYKPFPSFIKESVEYNARNLDEKLELTFDWYDSYTVQNLYFAHANVFSYGNWSYLNTEEEFNENLKSLVDAGCSVGIFGHTHRAKYKSSDKKNTSLEDLVKVVVPKGNKAIFTSGSLGQPRNSLSSFIIVEIKNDQIHVESRLLEYSLDVHRNSIIESELSQATKDKLLSYYN